MENFILSSLGHVIITVQAYKAQVWLTQHCNCQKVDDVWANRRRTPTPSHPPGSHLHKECTQKGRSNKPHAAGNEHWQKGKNSSLKYSRLRPCESGATPQEGTESLLGQESNQKILLLQVHNPSSPWRSAAAASAVQVGDY